jgi:hypothetical protein
MLYLLLFGINMPIIASFPGAGSYAAQGLEQDLSSELFSYENGLY